MPLFLGVITSFPSAFQPCKMGQHQSAVSWVSVVHDFKRHVHRFGRRADGVTGPSQLTERNWRREEDRPNLCSGSLSGAPNGQSALVPTKEIVPMKIVQHVLWSNRDYFWTDTFIDSCIFQHFKLQDFSKITKGQRVVGSSDASSRMSGLLSSLVTLPFVCAGMISFRTWESGEWFEAQLSDRW